MHNLSDLISARADFQFVLKTVVYNSRVSQAHHSKEDKRRESLRSAQERGRFWEIGVAAEEHKRRTTRGHAQKSKAREKQQADSSRYGPSCEPGVVTS